MRKKKIKFSYSTKHSLEEEQILFEKNKWFYNVDFYLKKIDDIEFVHDINSSETKKIIEGNNIDLTFVFGTSVLKKKITRNFFW